MLPRHLPPTATPLPPSLLARGLAAPSDAHDRLRAALATTLGIDNCRFASTGRTVLYLLLVALSDATKETDRTQVVLPAYTCPSVAKVILEAELEPRLVDISPLTMAVDADGLNAAISEQTLAVVLVHPFGIPQDLEPSLTLAREAGAVVIEDVAQSMGAQIRDRAAGSFGHYGIFSLGPGKPLSAGGGGIVCANALGDANLLEAAWQQLPAQSRLADVTALARLAAFQTAFQPAGWWLAMKAGAQRVGDDEANWGFALTDLSAAQASIAAAQLPRLEMYNRQRREHAALLISALETVPGLVIPPPATGGEPIYLRLPLLFDDPDACLAVHDALQAAGIGAGRMYKRTLASIFPKMSGEFPGAEAVAQGLLTLPTHHHLRLQDLEQMAAIVRSQAAMKSH